MAFLGCFGGFCPPIFSAPFKFKPFLSFRACKWMGQSTQEVPSLIRGITSLLLLFIMVCNTGCFNSVVGAGRQWWRVMGNLNIHNHLDQSLHLPLHPPNCLSSTMVRTIAPGTFHVDYPHSWPTLTGGPRLTPVLWLTLITMGLSTLISLSIIPQGWGCILPHKMGHQTC